MTRPAARSLLRAAWVAPMDGPAIPNGAVLIDGDRIAAVGPAPELRPASAGAEVHDYGDAVILPGLINAHCHLELSHLSPPQPAPKFIDWIMTVLGSAGDAAIAAASARAGAADSLRHGVTTVGDVSRHCAATRAALHDSPLRVVSFGEVLGMARRKDQLAPRLAAAVDQAHAGEYLLPGVSPHAPYSTDADGYRRCLAAARQHRLPLTTHLAETSDENAFLSDHAGPFRELWERLGAWDDAAVPRFPGGPVRYAASLGLLEDERVSLAHVNYCDDADLALLARGRASVIYCPRTHAYFGHPPHRWRAMLAAGVNVALGTDSRASSADLNLLDDLRLLHRLAPEVPAQELWQLVSRNAARALRLERTTGSLTPGKAADVVLFSTTGPQPLEELLEIDTRPRAVWLNGSALAVTG